jgi:hypothetical protein
MDEFVFAILEGLVGVCIIYIMRYVIPFLRIKLQSVIDVVTWDAIVKEVKSVEQTMKGKGLGVAKKEEVLVRITAWANKHGIAITQEQISQLIETAVFVMNNEDKK